MSKRARCHLCPDESIYTWGSGETDDPVPIALCLTHTILLQLALHLDWSD